MPSNDKDFDFFELVDFGVKSIGDFDLDFLGFGEFFGVSNNLGDEFFEDKDSDDKERFSGERELFVGITVFCSCFVGISNCSSSVSSLDICACFLFLINNSNEIL